MITDFNDCSGIYAALFYQMHYGVEFERKVLSEFTLIWLFLFKRQYKCPECKANLRRLKDGISCKSCGELLVNKLLVPQWNDSAISMEIARLCIEFSQHPR